MDERVVSFLVGVVVAALMFAALGLGRQEYQASGGPWVDGGVVYQCIPAQEG